MTIDLSSGGMMRGLLVVPQIPRIFCGTLIYASVHTMEPSVEQIVLRRQIAAGVAMKAQLSCALTVYPFQTIILNTMF